MDFRRLLPAFTLATAAQACSGNKHPSVMPEIPTCNPSYMRVNGRVVSRNEGFSIGGWTPLSDYQVRFNTSRMLAPEERDLSPSELSAASAADTSKFLCIYHTNNTAGAYEVYWYNDTTRQRFLGRTTTHHRSLTPLGVPLSYAETITFLNQFGLARGDYALENPNDRFDVRLSVRVDEDHSLDAWRREARAVKERHPNIQETSESHQSGTTMMFATMIALIISTALNIFQLLFHRPLQAIQTMITAGHGAIMQDTFQFKLLKLYAEKVLSMDLNAVLSQPPPAPSTDYLTPPEIIHHSHHH